uniref:Uncharacterized LOC116407692 n=1 Tax=Xenopus tropicalis TaxID=8364 RepID=A0A803K3P8_XENTR
MEWSQRSSRRMVGISSRCPQSDFQWLMDLLQSHFSQLVSGVRYLPITSYSHWKMEVPGSPVGILYHRLKYETITNVAESLYKDELMYLSSCLDKQNVMVVLDDVEDLTETKRIPSANPTINSCSSLLLLIPKANKEKTFLDQIDSISRFLRGERTSASSSGFTEMDYKHTHSVDTGATQQFSRKNPKLDVPSGQKHSVRVFSRCAKSSYNWLLDLLQNEDFGSLVKEVHAVEITNTLPKFVSDANNCTFAILYHSLHHGHLSITDVPDSLYEEHLKDLSQRLGKEKVIVVLDDLKESSFQEKRRILQNQPSIGRYSQELLLFSETEKKSGGYASGIIQDRLEILKKSMETSRSGDDQFPLRSEGTGISRGTESARTPADTHIFGQKLDQILSIIQQMRTELSNQKQQLEEFKKEHHQEISSLIQQHHEEISRQNQQHQAEIPRMIQQHQAEITRLVQQHQAEITRLAQQHQAEIPRLVQQHQAEITRLAQQHQAEIPRLVQQHQAEITRLAQQHQAEIPRLVQQHQAEITRLAQQHQAEIPRMIQQHQAEITRL